MRDGCVSRTNRGMDKGMQQSQRHPLEICAERDLRPVAIRAPFRARTRTDMLILLRPTGISAGGGSYTIGVGGNRGREEWDTDLKCPPRVTRRELKYFSEWPSVARPSRTITTRAGKGEDRAHNIHLVPQPPTPPGAPMFRSNSGHEKVRHDGQHGAHEDPGSRRTIPGALDRMGLRREASTERGGGGSSTKRRRLTLHKPSVNAADNEPYFLPSGGNTSGVSSGIAQEPPRPLAASSAYDRFDERGWLRGLAWQIRRAVNRPSTATPVASSVSPSSRIPRSAMGTRRSTQAHTPSRMPQPDNHPTQLLQTEIPSHSLSFGSINGGPETPSPAFSTALSPHHSTLPLDPNDSLATVRFGPRRSGVYRDQSVQAEIEPDAEPKAKRPRLDVPELPTLPSLHLTPPEKKKSLVSEILGDEALESSKPRSTTAGRSKAHQEEKNSQAAVERAQQSARALSELFDSGGLSARSGKKRPDVGSEVARSFMPLSTESVQQRQRHCAKSSQSALARTSQDTDKGSCPSNSGLRHHTNSDSENEPRSSSSSSNSDSSTESDEESSSGSSADSNEESPSASSEGQSESEGNESEDNLAAPAQHIPPSHFAANFIGQNGELDIDNLLEARGKLAAAQLRPRSEDMQVDSGEPKQKPRTQPPKLIEVSGAYFAL